MEDEALREEKPVRQRVARAVERITRIRAMAKKDRALASEPGWGDPVRGIHLRRNADVLEGEAAALAELPATPEVGLGGELKPLPELEHEQPWSPAKSQDPTILTVDASLNRVELAAGARALALGLDAGETIKARNSLELMLAQQLGAAHAMAMRLADRAHVQLDAAASCHHHEHRREASVEAARLSGASARMMETFQRGVLALERLRNGGKQVVVVQHVNVSGDGKGVVAGTMERAAAGGGHGGK